MFKITNKTWANPQVRLCTAANPHNGKFWFANIVSKVLQNVQLKFPKGYRPTVRDIGNAQVLPASITTYMYMQVGPTDPCLPAVHTEPFFPSVYKAII